MENNTGSANVSNEIMKYQKSDFDIKYLWAKVVGNWHWFALSVGLMLGVALLYILYGAPSFNVSATVLVKGDNTNKINSYTSETDVLRKLGLFSVPIDVNNEVQQIRSRTNIERAIKDLQLNVSYWGQGDIRFQEIYKRSPFVIELLNLKTGLEYPLEWDVRITKDNKVFFRDLETNETATLNWGDTTPAKFSKFCSFIVKKNPDPRIVETEPGLPRGLKVASYGNTFGAFSSNLLVALSAINTTEINLTYSTTVPQKGEDFLNYLIALYQQRHIDYNNLTADSTIAFIENRIKGVEAELSGVESGLQNIQTSGSITDFTDVSSILNQSRNQSSQTLVQQNSQISSVQQVEDFLTNQSNDNRTLPSSASINDQGYLQQQQNYNTLQQERLRLLQTTTEQNPQVKTVDDQLNATRNNLTQIVRGYKQNLITQRDNYNNRDFGIQQQISRLPVQKRQYLDLARRQDVLQQLYVYLLTTREQTAVAGKNDFGPIRIIDAPKAAVQPYWPNKLIVIIAAILLGLIIPGAVIFIQELLNTKVLTPSDIAASTAAPVIAEISHTRSKNSVIVTRESRSAVAEQFRTLRTNLLFNMSNNNQKVILCTSNVSDEGKSFVSLNLATAFALTDKKVLIVDLDLRRKQLTERLEMEDRKGLGDYMESNTLGVSDILQPSSIDNNLWVVTSGNSAANPSEMLLSNRLASFFEDVKKRFDFIILDTPPVAVVTDAQVVSKYSDLTLYMVRQKHTYKKHIDVIEELRAGNKLKNIHVVLNDVSLVAGYNHGYGYGFRFDEGYDYYQEDANEKKPFWKKIFSNQAL